MARRTLRVSLFAPIPLDELIPIAHYLIETWEILEEVGGVPRRCQIVKVE